MGRNDNSSRRNTFAATGQPNTFNPICQSPAQRGRLDQKRLVELVES